MLEPIDIRIEDRIIAMFDSFCKTVLRNIARNIRRQLIRQKRQKKRVALDIDVQQTIYTAIYQDNYTSDHFIITVGDLTAGVNDEDVYFALTTLPDRQLTVLVLDFWYEWSDKDIAKKMEVSARTVYNLRQRAFMSIRRFYEQGAKENQIDV